MAATKGPRQATSVRGAGGFSIIELMAVVTILAVLTMAAVVSYRKYSMRGKNMEAIHMLSEIGMKQALHFSLYGEYVDSFPCTPDNQQFSNSSFYPETIGEGPQEWEISCPDDADTYPGWCALGIRPSGEVQYQYVTGGWAPGDAIAPINIPSDGPNGSAPMLLADAMTTQWWYAVARGDLDQNGLYKTFVFTSEVNEVFTIGLTE